MNILHIIDSLKPGGAERMLVDLVNATVSSENGHQLTVCVTLSDDQMPLAAELAPEVRQVALNRMALQERTRANLPLRFWKEIKAMRGLIQLANQHADLIQAHSRSSVMFLSLLKMMRLLQPPIVMHDHFGEIETNDRVPAWFRAWGRHCIAQYVGVSEKLVAWAQNAGLSPDQTHVIGNALDLRRLQAAEPIDLHATFTIPPDQPIGVIVGGIRAQKGIDLLLDALQYSQQRDRCHLLIIGADRDAAYGAAMRDRATAAGYPITFTGERRDVPAIVQAADFALIPSRSESGPLVLIEYLAAGLPIVAFETGNIAAQSAALGVPGFVPPMDTRAFAKKLDNLLTLNQAARRQQGMKGLAIAEQHFDIHAKMQDWYGIYARALTTRNTLIK